MAKKPSRKPRGPYPRPQNKKGEKPLPKYKRMPFSWLIIAAAVFTAMMLLPKIADNRIDWNDFETFLEENLIESVEVGDCSVLAGVVHYQQVTR